MAAELKPLLLDETGKEMRDSIIAISNAIKNTDTVQKAKEEIQAEGATQVANVKAASEEIIGKVEQIDQNTQRIAELKGDLVDLENNLYASFPTDTEIKTLHANIVQGKFLNKDTGAETIYATASYTKINVKGGEQYLVSCYVYGNSAIVFYDDNSHMSGYDITNIKGVVDYPVTIPKGATIMGVSTIYTENPVSVKKPETVIANIKPEIDIVKNNEQVLLDIPNVLPSKKCFVDCEFSVVNNKFLNKSNGGEGTYNGGAYAKISVHSGEKYYVSCFIRGDFGIVFYKDGIFISGASISDLNSISYYEVIIPDDANSMGVSTVDQTSNPISIKKFVNSIMDIKPILKRNSLGGYIYPRRPVICFTLDGDYDLNPTMEQIASNHGYPLTFAVKYPSFNDQSVVRKYKEYESKGHEIALHTYYSLWEYTDDEVMAFIKECYDTGIRNGFDIHGCIATAGSMDEKFLPIVKQRFDYCASIANHAGTWEGFETPCHDFLTSEPYKLWRYSMQMSTMEQQKAAIDDCIANNRLLMFYGHAQSQNNDYFNAQNFDELLTYIDGKVATHDVAVKTNFDAIRDFYTIRYDDVIGLLTHLIN